MKSFESPCRFLFWASLLLSSPAWFAPATPVRAQEKSVQIIEVSAKKYEYSPSPIRVKSGAKVQLKITAADHDHGFKIESDGGKFPGLVFTTPKDCWQLEKGQTTTIEFVAQTPGSYAFKCCHSCGFGHGHMKGEIVVE